MHAYNKPVQMFDQSNLCKTVYAMLFISVCRTRVVVCLQYTLYRLIGPLLLVTTYTIILGLAIQLNASRKNFVKKQFLFPSINEQILKLNLKLIQEQNQAIKQNFLK